MNEQSMDAMSTDATNRVACNEEATSERKIEWRPVVGYEGLYEVSNTGLIYSLYKHKLIKACPDQDGYLILNLYKRDSNNKLIRNTWKVHRLVALAFIPNPEAKEQIDHINGIKTDNFVENLRWADCKENINNPITMSKRNATIAEYWKDPKNRERRAARNNSPEFLEKLHAAQQDTEFRERMREVRRKDMRPVICLTDNDAYYESIQDASKLTGVGYHTICNACLRYENGDKRTTPWRTEKGRLIKNLWRWATPEEIAAHNQDNNQNPS